ncbi:DNA ligase D [Silvibacterium acidisoli]|uniref:DNA ligase D n=1 Tax=Acidobacteriaceae bacterium ZG23-2 TaxID=2883246 RepID=UPI00406CF503
MATTKKSAAKKPVSAKKSAAKKSPAAKKAASKPSPADSVDEQLARYREMRDFSVTAEPSGKTSSQAKAGQLPFVIQKHAASHLHYDFRLGWNGVLKSWACAKGPSYNPRDKRLAVQVEDHPIEYGGFEGIIPKGQYGGGTVMIWDQGTWAPQAGHTDVDEGLKKGSLKFTMFGTKMKGNWALVRMGGKAAGERKPNWLLIKEHDDYERGDGDPAITDEQPNSAVTGRDLDQIASQEDHVWNSRETGSKKAWYRKESNDEPAKAAKPAASAAKTIAIPRTPREALPDFIAPQLAIPAETPPGSVGWVHELKLDGYRIQARKDGGKVKLFTRTGLDWTHRMKTIAEEVAALPVNKALFDGEVVVLAENGTTSFADLQAAFQEGVKKPLTYFLFDLLHLNGHNLRGLPLVERKALLADVLKDAGEYLHYSEHLESSGETMLQHACELHAEGIISKKADGQYVSGRTSNWQKLKCLREQEFVIGGFTLPSNGSHGIGALLLGYYQGGKLIYAGRTGTGFTQRTHRILRDKLDDLRRTSMPFENPPAEARRGAIWVDPKLVAQVRFATWTADNLVRQAAFLGLREDKPAKEVAREEASAAPRPKAARSASHRAPAAKAAKAVAKKTAVTDDSDAPPVRLTHPDKVLDTESGLTKQQLASYYWEIADHLLPHIEGRPLSLVRCPEGTGKECFFQKHNNRMLPEIVGSVGVPDKKTGKVEPYITLSSREALASLAQIGVLEIHPWGSRNDDLEHPDRVIIDLDPDAAVAWKTLATAAEEVRGAFKELGLESFLKLTGGKGLHVVVPVKPQRTWAEVKQFAHSFVLEIEKRNPSLYLTKMTKAARKDKIYLDYLRNERGATAVTAFSPRARAGAHVSMPLDWEELKMRKLPVFEVVDFERWKSRLSHDPWKKMPSLKQSIPKELFE